MWPFGRRGKDGDEDKKRRLDEAVSNLNTGHVAAGMAMLYELGMENYPEAEFWLGDINEFQVGNLDEAVKWYTYAAEHGHPRAQRCLADLYMTGKGVREDHAEAVKWYKQAATNGIPAAQFVMGEILRAGKDAPRDLDEAHTWYTRALENGYAQAQVRLDQLAMGAGAEATPMAAGRTVVTYADLHDAPAHMLMATGLSWFLGDGVPQDLRRAAEYVEVAAEKGLADAQFMIGKMYWGGQGIDKDLETALFWLEKAASQHYQRALPEVVKLRARGVSPRRRRRVKDGESPN